MAVDTEAKRWGMMQWASGPSVYPTLINPDTSGLNAIERATILKLYGGIAFDAPTSVATPSVYVGEFTLETTGAGGTQTITGVGFTPKAVILYTAGGTASDEATSTYWRAIGFAASPGEESNMAYTVHGGNKIAGNEDFSRIQSQSVLRIARVADENASEEFSFNSFNSDGFVLNKDVVGGAKVIKYVAIGGDDLQASVIHGSSPTSASTKEFTGVGFEPQAIFAVTGLVNDADPPIGYDTRQRLDITSIGFASSTTEQWCMGIGTDNSNPNDATRIFDSTALIHAPFRDASYVRADLDSFDSDGFTLDFTKTLSSARGMAFLCLRGAAFKAGKVTAPTATGASTEAYTGIGVQPAALILGSNDCTADATVTDGDAHFGFGAASATDERHAIWSGLQQNSGSTWDSSRAHENDQIIYDAAPNGASPSVNRVADLASFDSDGFTLDWNVTVSAATNLGYFAIGTASAVAEPETPAGGGRGAKRSGKRAGCRYPRRVMIDGKLYKVCSAEEERQLLEAYRERLEREALELALENAPKKEIAKAKVRVVRAQRRVEEVDDREDAWLDYLKEEDEIIVSSIH